MGAAINTVRGELKAGEDLFHLFVKIAGNITGILSGTDGKGLLTVHDISIRQGNGDLRYEGYGRKCPQDQIADFLIVGAKAQVSIIVLPETLLRSGFYGIIIRADLEEDLQLGGDEDVDPEQGYEVIVSDFVEKVQICVIAQDGICVINPDNVAGVLQQKMIAVRVEYVGQSFRHGELLTALIRALFMLQVERNVAGLACGKRLCRGVGVVVQQIDDLPYLLLRCLADALVVSVVDHIGYGCHGDTRLLGDVPDSIFFAHSLFIYCRVSFVNQSMINPEK